MSRAMKRAVLTLVLAASAGIHADTMYWWKDAATTDFLDLANWRVESEAGATPVAALATNAADTAVFQKVHASVAVPAGTELAVGNLTVGTNADNSDSSLVLALGAGAKLVGSGKLLMPQGRYAIKSMRVDAPSGGTFSFAGGIEFNRHGDLTFTGAGLVLTNTPLFNFRYADNRVSFPAGTTIETTVLQPPSSEGDFGFSVAGPNSIVRGLTYSWGNSSQTIAVGDSLVVFTNGVTLTDLDFEYFRGRQNRIVLEDVDAAFAKNMTVKDDLNVFTAKDATLAFKGVSLAGRTNAVVIVDAEVTADSLTVGQNGSHVLPTLVFTNATVATAGNVGLSGLNGRIEIVDSVVESQGMNIGAVSTATGNVVTVSGPAARLTVTKPDNSAQISLASENATSGSDNMLIVTNGATLVVNKMRIGGYAGVNGHTLGIYDGAVVTNTGIFRFCNAGNSSRGGERGRIVVDNAEFVCQSEIQFGGSNNLVRVANGGVWRSTNGSAATGLIVGGGFDFQVDDGAILLTNTLMVSSDASLPSHITIGGPRGRIRCKDIQCAAADLTLRISKEGRTIDEPMLQLTYHTLTSKGTLFPDDVNLTLKLEIDGGVRQETVGEYIDLIDISHFKGVLGAGFLNLTNGIDQASLKGCTLAYVPGSGGVQNACLRLYPPRAGGLVLIVR